MHISANQQIAEQINPQSEIRNPKFRDPASAQYRHSPGPVRRPPGIYLEQEEQARVASAPGLELAWPLLMIMSADR
jgi:hypothetical protein